MNRSLAARQGHVTRKRNMRLICPLCDQPIGYGGAIERDCTQPRHVQVALKVVNRATWVLAWVFLVCLAVTAVVAIGRAA